MKEKEQAITIFSKNNITIKKCHIRNAIEAGIYIPRISRIYNASFPIVEYITSSISTNFNHPGCGKTSSKSEYKIIRCESPLGFYYNKKVYVKNEPTFKPKVEDCRKDIVHVLFYGFDSDYIYELTYLTSYHGTQVNIETRPWDLCGGSFPDNYLFGLLKDVNDIFDNIESCKTNIGYSYNSSSCREDSISNESVHNIRRTVIKDLFGDPEGPKFQTNEEKILAHGFDLKTSFRKM